MVFFTKFNKQINNQNWKNIIIYYKLNLSFLNTNIKKNILVVELQKQPSIYSYKYC